MSTSLPRLDGTDPETPLSVLRRFGITTTAMDLDRCTVAAAMPLDGMTNPFTGRPSLAGLAVLVDDVAGRVNYLRCGRGQWTVSSELSLEVSPGAVAGLLAATGEPVIAAARPLGAAGSTLLSVCTLTHRGVVIGGGTVHTVPISGGPAEPPRRGEDPLAGRPGSTLADLMAVEALPADGGTVRLRQLPDPMINNLIGIVHGGVSAAGLELVAAAALDRGSGGELDPLQTASIRVNFLRPFSAAAGPGAQSVGAQSVGAQSVGAQSVGAQSVGAQSVYEGTALRIGRTAAVADARAVNEDGAVAVIARVTAYR